MLIFIYSSGNVFTTVFHNFKISIFVLVQIHQCELCFDPLVWFFDWFPVIHGFHHCKQGWLILQKSWNLWILLHAVPAAALLTPIFSINNIR